MSDAPHDLDRRTFLKTAGVLTCWPFVASADGIREEGIWVNDLHSQLNRTKVSGVVFPDSIEAIQRALRHARQNGKALSVAGGRHAAGGQQFGTGAVLLDMTKMDRVLSLDANRGIVEVEAGIKWTGLIAYLLMAQENQPRQWGIAQKQTGANELTIGGAVAANAHGRGLTMRPIIADIEAFTLLDSEGNIRTCSRSENSDLFRLVVGGYGLFGVVCSIRLRLAPRKKLERVVEITEVEDLAGLFKSRVDRQSSAHASRGFHGRRRQRHERRRMEQLPWPEPAQTSNAERRAGL